MESVKNFIKKLFSNSDEISYGRFLSFLSFIMGVALSFISIFYTVDVNIIYAFLGVATGNYITTKVSGLFNKPTTEN